MTAKPTKLTIDNMTDPITGQRTNVVHVNGRETQRVRVNYEVVPNAPVNAKIIGVEARCGKCNRKLGEFVKAEGVIQCSKPECKAKNIVRI